MSRGCPPGRAWCKNPDIPRRSWPYRHEAVYVSELPGLAAFTAADADGLPVEPVFGPCFLGNLAQCLVAAFSLAVDDDVLRAGTLAHLPSAPPPMPAFMHLTTRAAFYLRGGQVNTGLARRQNYAKGWLCVGPSLDIIKTGDLTKLTDSNLLSAPRSWPRDSRACLEPRKADDTAKGLITFLKGLVSEGLLKARAVGSRSEHSSILYARRHGRRRR